MAPRLLPRVALGLIGMAVTQAICAAPQVDQAGRSRAALAAEWLQQCLDTDSHLVSIEEGLAPGGSLQRSLASSPLATRSATSLAQRMQQCSAKSAAAHSCALPGSLRQPLAIEVVEGEAHPAWSANDRARVAEVLRDVGARAVCHLAALAKPPLSARPPAVLGRENNAKHFVLSNRITESKSK